MAKSMILTAEQALNTYKGKSLTELNKAANELTKVEGDASVMRRVISICYWAGHACKAKGLNADATEKTVGDTYLNFASGWYVKGMGGKREPLSKETLANYKSAVQGFGLLGTTSWNSQPCILAVMHGTDRNNKPLSLGTQGSKARKFAAMEKAPDAKTINATIKGKGSARTGGRKPVSIIGDALDSAEKIADTKAVIDYGKGDKGVGAALKEFFAAAAMLREALADRMPMDTAERKAAKNEYRNLAKVTKVAAVAVSKGA